MRSTQSLLTGLLLGCMFSCLVLSCHKTELRSEIHVDDKYTVVSTLTGTGAAQPNASAASGTFSGHFDETTGSLSFSLSWTQLSNVVRNIEIQGGGSEPIPVTGFTFSRNGTLFSAVTLPDEALPDLLNGAYFVTIATSTYPSGEIRGVLKVK